MAIANIHEAKTQLSKLVERALEGEEVIIARAGKPAVRKRGKGSEAGKRSGEKGQDP
jgi:antitoxin (DNA-binding transcriptional repressor) of toxin-antitoxin stability system